MSDRSRNKSACLYRWIIVITLRSNARIRDAIRSARQNPQPSTQGKDVQFQSLRSPALSGRATYLARSGVAESARWLVDDLTAAFAEVGRPGATTMQWSEGRRGPMQIGDAAMGQDALSSQGLAVGLFDAVQSVLAHLGHGDCFGCLPRPDDFSGRSLVAEIVAMSPFAGDPSGPNTSSFCATTNGRSAIRRGPL